MKTREMLKVIPLITLALLMSCSGEKKDAATDTHDEKVKVKIEQVSSQDVDQIADFTATVEANIKNNIAPQSPVRIAKLFAEVGDHVKEGQVLVKMDDTSLAQAKIQLDNQEIEFNRIDELYKVGGASKSAWDAQKTQLDVSRASYKNLQENTQLLSPVTGVITARNYDSGDMYSGGDPVYTVEQIRPVKLLLHVSESYFTQVKKGNERVRPGMFARATMNFGTRNHVVAPDQAIVKQSGSGDRYIYVYKDGKVSYQKVELGRRMGNKYEIISGVDNGDQVVITGQNRLNNGMEVEIDK